MQNVADALDRFPSIAGRVELLAMAGDLGHVVNDDERVSDTNVRCNVEAAQTVFTADWKRFLLAPLHSSRRIRLTGETYRRVYESDDLAARTVVSAHHAYAGESRIYSGDPEHDSSALFDTLAVYMAWSTEYVEVERFPLRISDDGYTTVDKKGWPVYVARDWRSDSAYESYESLLVDRMTG